jgi:hypothetical protein
VTAEPIAETRDLYGAFPRLTETQIGNLEVHGERRRTQAGRWAGDRRARTAALPRELSLLEGQPAFYSAVVAGPGGQAGAS